MKRTVNSEWWMVDSSRKILFWLFALSIYYSLSTIHCPFAYAADDTAPASAAETTEPATTQSVEVVSDAPTADQPLPSETDKSEWTETDAAAPAWTDPDEWLDEDEALMEEQAWVEDQPWVEQPPPAENSSTEE